MLFNRYQKRWFRLRRTPIARERLEEHRNPEQGDGVPDNNNESNQEQVSQRLGPLSHGNSTMQGFKRL